MKNVRSVRIACSYNYSMMHAIHFEARNKCDKKFKQIYKFMII